jgi:hypothetical protein
MTEPISDETSTPTRVCPKCSTQSTTSGNFCPQCGSSFVRKSRVSRRTVLVASGVVLTLLVVGGVGWLVKKQADEADAAERAEAQAAKVEEAEAAQEAADEDEREMRASMVKELEKSVTKSAKEAVDDGILEGPIKSSSCTATGGGSIDDLTALTGTFECIAINKENDDGTSSGYAYTGTIEWDTGEYQWQLGG